MGQMFKVGVIGTFLFLNFSRAEVAIRFVAIPAGTFLMGSPLDQPRFFTEVPHNVTMSAFELQTTPVTQFQWAKLMGTNPSEFKTAEICGSELEVVNGVSVCPDYPVEGITWQEAQDFAAKMNDRNDGFTYRLPTEAEWEYSARAGTITPYWFGSDTRLVDANVWYSKNSNGHTHRVATKPSNPWRLYDMTGNVWQWVHDYFGGPYSSADVTDPQGPMSGQWHSFRGCSWNTDNDAGECPNPCRSAYRNFEDFIPGSSYMVGFRLAREKNTR